MGNNSLKKYLIKSRCISVYGWRYRNTLSRSKMHRTKKKHSLRLLYKDLDKE